MTETTIIILAAVAIHLAYVARKARERIAGLEYRLSRARCAAWAYRETAVHYAGIAGNRRAGTQVDWYAESVCAREGDDLTAADLAYEADGRHYPKLTR